MIKRMQGGVRGEGKVRKENGTEKMAEWTGLMVVGGAEDVVDVDAHGPKRGQGSLQEVLGLPPDLHSSRCTAW